MPLREIEISGYKNLDALHITNLQKINYIIGASGAGKSTVWELLTLLFRKSFSGGGMEQYGDLRQLIPDSAKVYIVLQDGNGHTGYTFTLRAQSEFSVAVNETPLAPGLPIQILSTEQKETNFDFIKTRISSAYNPTKYAGHMTEALIKVADTNGGIATFDLVHVTPPEKTTSPAVLRGGARTQVMSTAGLSGGHSALSSLIAAVENNLGSIIVLEEPENGMHVDLQKSLHSTLKEIINDRDDTQVVVITHSPFVLSSIDKAETNVNTFLMNEGKMLKPEGYGAEGAKYLASRLVGLNFEDIAPDKIVVSEGSLATLLRIVNDRFYSCSTMFTSAKSNMGGESSGDSDILTLADAELVVKNRFNFFDKANLTFIIDKPNDGQKEIKGRVERLLAKDTNIITLSEYAIENFYANFEQLEPESKLFILDNSNNKKLRAEKLAYVVSKEEFERVFVELLPVFK